MLPSVVTLQISLFIFLLDYANMQYTNDAISLQNATCPSGQFRCDSSQCIDELKLCDGTANCYDNSDETIDVCNSEQCPDVSFKCEYGACIHMNGRCNGFKDCFDWSDEESCSYTETFDYFGCELPENPPHGEYAVISHLWGGYHSRDIIPTYDVLSLSCHKGYIVNPPEDDGLSYCLPTHEWMPIPKTCVRKSLFSAGCRLPNNPSNGKYVVINHVSAGYKPGDIVPVFSLLVVNCDNGYAGNPLELHQVSYCLSTEEWSPAPNTCKVMSVPSEGGCKIPNHPSYGRYSIESALSLPSRLKFELTSGDIVPVNSQLSLKCFKGSKVNPSDDKLSNCTLRGEWSPAPKTCVYPDSKCQVPSNPLHGKYVVINHSSNSDANSEKVNIPGDLVPLHSLLSLKCNKGYEVNPLTNDDPSNCTSTGKWVPPPKTCFQGCRLPNNPLHGKYVVNYDEHYPGDLVPMHRLLTVHCNEGYEVSPPTDDEPSNCTSTGKWVPSPKTCFQGCRFPNHPLNGEYTVEDGQTEFDKYYLGDIVPIGRSLSIHCNEGYEVSPSMDDKPSNCTSTGKWIPSPKTCFQGCRFPNHSLNGEYTVEDDPTESDKYYLGDIVPIGRSLSIHCNEGYTVSPSKDNEPSNCTLTGKWVPYPKTCSKGCLFPNNPLNGKYMVQNDNTEDDQYHSGDIVPEHSLLFTICNKGYEVSLSTDNEPAYCTSIGKWIPFPKTCFQGCRFPDNPLNGKYMVQDTKDDKYYPGDNVPVDSLLFVICHEGYEVSSSTSDDPAICTSTGKWSFIPETCVRSSVVNQGCQIPSSPFDGLYIINNSLSSEYKPGDVVPVESVLSVNCNTGYVDNPPPDIVNLSRCELTGEWIPAPKTCARACPLLISTDTTNVVCEFNGKPLNTCSNAVENTIARLSCAPFYEESNLEKYPTRSCNNGSWKYPIPQCYPICGKTDPSSNTNTYLNQFSFKTWFPWFVNIYRKFDDLGETKYICRGSIIKERIVLSAAICFANEVGNKYIKEDFFIAADKKYNGYSDPRDNNPQYSRVHAIHIPETFKGITNYYEADIAIIILPTPFQLTANVQPVCIDLETEFDGKSIDYGMVTGLGEILDNHEDKLLEMDNKEILSVLPYNKCLEKADDNYRKFITHDKVCLKFSDINFSIICVKPSGSGFAYPKESTDRFFIRGIASTEFRSTNASLCSLAYTSVDRHIDFIRKITTMYSRQ